jgi:hypothetical protein
MGYGKEFVFMGGHPNETVLDLIKVYLNCKKNVL